MAWRGTLRVVRNVLVADVLARTRPFGPTYGLANAILAAVDAMADHMADVDDFVQCDSRRDHRFVRFGAQAATGLILRFFEVQRAT